MSIQRCRSCGCHQFDACWSPTTGGCWWVEPDLCSAAECGGQQPDAYRDTDMRDVLDLRAMRQHDDHIWLTIHGEAWAIHRIDGTVWHLWRGYAPAIEHLVIEVTGFDFDGYCESAAQLLADEGPRP